MQSQAAPRLHTTIGIEIEFILVKFFRDERPAGSQSRDRMYGIRLVHEALSEPMAVHCHVCGDEYDFYLPLNATERDQEETYSDESDADEENYSAWSVKIEDLDLSKEDKEILEQGGGGFESFGVEVISRILHIDKALPSTTRDDNNYDDDEEEEHVHAISYDQEMRGVLSTLNEKFNTTEGSTGDRSHARVLVNTGCGLHIHVGNKSKGFPLSTVKNAVSVYTACEQLIDSMHDVTRVSGTRIAMHAPNDSITNYYVKELLIGEPAYNSPLSDAFLRNAYKACRMVRENISSSQNDYFPHTHLDDPAIRRAAVRFDTAGFVDVIQLSPDLYAVRQVLWGKRVTVNPTPLLDSRSTIEFRQHGPTLDAKVALAWTDFVQRLVNFAHETSTPDFLKLCEQQFFRPEHTLADLLNTLGVSASTSAFYLDRTDESSTTAATAALSAVNDAKVFTASETDKTLSQLVVKSIERLSQVNDPDEVESRILENFVGGGYGQFSKEYLEKCNIPLYGIEQKKLTIGWEAEPLVAVEDGEESIEDENIQLR